MFIYRHVWHKRKIQSVVAIRIQYVMHRVLACLSMAADINKSPIEQQNHIYITKYGSTWYIRDDHGLSPLTVYVKTNHVDKNVFAFFWWLSQTYCLMDLRCKFGVDCSLFARDRTIFICAILKTNIPKMAIFSWNYVN